MSARDSLSEFSYEIHKSSNRICGSHGNDLSALENNIIENGLFFKKSKFRFILHIIHFSKRKYTNV
jgi:hypothetical protein